MILKRITFNQLFKKIQDIFCNAISRNKLQRIKKKLFKDIESLAEVNFVCYQTNMQLIEEWENKSKNLKVISDLDLRIRKYGEYRVKKKNNINAFIHSIFNARPRKITIENWMDIDLAYTIGDMIDRLIIETIKIADYEMRLNKVKKDQKKIFLSKKILAEKWIEGVMMCLSKKLSNINDKKFYEITKETRTYNIKKI